MSGARTRRKGIVAEREVANLFEQAGFEVRGLEGQGDHLALRGSTFEPPFLVFHLEIKRQEALRVPEWLRQCVEEAPNGTLPVLCFRRSREKWVACLQLDDFLNLLSVPEPEQDPSLVEDESAEKEAA